MGTAADKAVNDQRPEIDSIENVQVWCDVCGHTWEPNKNPFESKYPECSNCNNKSKSKLYADTNGGTYDLTGSPADMEYAEADANDSESLDSMSETTVTSPPESDTKGQVKPDDFGLETEEEAQDDVQDIYEHTIASFPSWGRNSPKTERIEQYLIERGESNLTPPSPAELREWTSTISGIGDDVARNISTNYEQELTNAIASGRIDRDDLQNVYSSTLAQIGDTDMGPTQQQGGMNPRMAAALQAPQQEQQQSSQQDMMERLVEQSDSLGPEAMLMKEMETDDMDPMTVMLLMDRMDAGSQESGSDVPDELSDALTGLADAVENINTRISTLEERVDNTDSESNNPLSSAKELAEMRDTMVDLGMADDPSQTRQQTGNTAANDEVTNTLSMLMNRIDGLENEIKSEGGTERNELESHIGRILEQTNDPDQARDLLAIAGKTSVDPEVRKKELELEMQREELDNKNDSLETLLDGFQKVADRASSSFAEAIMSSNDEYPVRKSDPECDACGWSGDSDMLVGEVVFCENCGVPLVLERTAAEVQQAAQQQQYLPDNSQPRDSEPPTEDDVEDVIEETKEVLDDDSGIPDVPDVDEYAPSGGDMTDDTDESADTQVEAEETTPPAPNHSKTESDGEEQTEDEVDESTEQDTADNKQDESPQQDDKQDDVHNCECGKEFATKAELNGHKAHCEEEE